MKAVHALLTLVLALALAAPFEPAIAADAAPQELATKIPGCGYSSQVDALLGELSQDSWSAWVRRVSGDMDVLVGGKPTRIRTRYSPTLFDGASPGFVYLQEQLAAWNYPAQQIEVHEFPAPSWIAPGQTWKNLVLTIPGSTTPNEVVILSAHLDSTSPDPLNNAPGANDNATGAAALLEAARVLRGKSLQRTLRLIWFTGEEQGLVGSRAYTSDPQKLAGVAGVVNLDMFGYDGDGDRCFELHVGTLPASAQVGQCFARVIQTYGMDLRYDYLTSGATTRSDHAPFWERGVGALEVLENVSYNGQPNGCTGADPSPYYHKITDTFANLMPGYGFSVARAGLAAAFSLANPVPLETLYLPVLLRFEE